LTALAKYRDTDKQREALKLMAANKTTLLEGGGRSGKTVRIIRSMIVRALHYPGSWHLAARLRLSHARVSLWQKTIPEVLSNMRIDGLVRKNHFNMCVDFPLTGGVSKLLVGGLDDKERTEKILGNEYATIFLNEASQISYDTYETVTTRLNPPKGVPPRFFLDYNPPSKRHWGYKIFHEREFPDGRPVPEGDYAWLKMNPRDNADNLDPSYFDTLDNLSISKRIRFRDGEYGTEEGALWRRDWIKYKQAPINLVRVVVGVDPSGSAGGDEIGIAVAGIDNEGKKYVLADHSMHGTPKEWGEEAVNAYNTTKADLIAAEKNFGGDMVEAVITQFGSKAVNVKLVNASRGKAVRAEPISAMYERNEVFHVKEFPALEDELCTWKPAEDTKSPNRLDALVWALTELSEDGGTLEWVG
jgi:PBSX family phage terminase large subunit